MSFGPKKDHSSRKRWKRSRRSQNFLEEEHPHPPPQPVFLRALSHRVTKNVAAATTRPRAMAV
jgi:hypothetical protein